MFHDLLERVIGEATQNHSSDGIYHAKKEYQKACGEIYEDDRSYESRMALFLEWYTFDRPLPGEGITPLEYIIDSKRRQTDDRAARDYEAFKESVHALFLVHKIKDLFVVVENLFDQQKYQVEETEGRLIFRKNDIFEARLFPFQGKFYFSGNYCFHPAEAHRFIRDEVRKIRTIELAHQRTLNEYEDQLRKLNKSRQKMASRIRKLKDKIHKTNKPEKAVELDKELGDLEVQNNEIQQKIAGTEADKQIFVREKIREEGHRNRERLIHRLSYMNLKWERSRQIDIHDIYRN